MKIKKIVKVMNFQTLLKISAAKAKAEIYQDVGKEVTDLLKMIVNNKNIILDKNILKADKTKPALNIYIANDYGFCGDFNASVRHQIKEDVDAYKIIIGKKILHSADDKTLLMLNKDEFHERVGEIEKTMDEALKDMSYSEINLYYNHYYSLTQFGFLKVKLFPLELDESEYDGHDFVSETDIMEMLKGLLSFYVCYEIKMAEEISVASENVLRNQITKMALDRIEEKEIEQKRDESKKRLSATILKNVENYKRIMESENE